jgi:hypothetical protein
MKQIPLTRGKIALVDDEDFEMLSAHKWYCNKGGYAVRATGPKGHQKGVFMTHVIMNCPEHLRVDHANGVQLDNQKYNLRVCTHAENGRNRRKHVADASSKYKGIYLHKKTGKWIVRIAIDRKRIFVGQFADETEAARAYDEAAKKYHGEFALLNF